MDVLYFAPNYICANGAASTCANGNKVTFLYDANRNRIKETSTVAAATPTTLLYLSGPARYEIQKGASVNSVAQWTHTHYVMAGGEMVGLHKVTGSYNTSTQVETKTAEFDQYFHTDHLGSIAAITDAVKAVLERFS